MPTNIKLISLNWNDFIQMRAADAENNLTRDKAIEKK